MCDVTSCLSCLSSLSRLVSFRMRSSITITEKANTLLTVTTRIVRLIISGTLGYFGTNHFSNPKPHRLTQCTPTSPKSVECLTYSIKGREPLSVNQKQCYGNVFDTSFYWKLNFGQNTDVRQENLSETTV